MVSTVFTHSKLLLSVIKMFRFDLPLSFQSGNNSLIFPAHLMGQAVKATKLVFKEDKKKKKIVTL